MIGSLKSNVSEIMIVTRTNIPHKRRSKLIFIFHKFYLSSKIDKSIIKIYPFIKSQKPYIAKKMS